MDCQYCRKTFSSKSSLNNHQKTAKYCIQLQGVENKSENKFTCNDCSKIFYQKQHLLTHLQSCKEKEFQDKFRNQEKEFDDKLRKQEKEFQDKLKDKMREKEQYIIKLITQNENYREQLEKQQEQIKDLQDKLDKIANKAIDKPTTTTNNTINNKFELNTFPSQKEIDRKIESQFNDKYILDGMKGIAQFVFDHIVKLEDGSMAYACYDNSRQMFKYKDEDLGTKTMQELILLTEECLIERDEYNKTALGFNKLTDRNDSKVKEFFKLRRIQNGKSV